MAEKWRTVPGGLDLITDPAHPVGFWRSVVTALHPVELEA